MNDENLPRDAYRSAMRRFAASVAIISAGYEGRRHGMTATAVTSLSLDPPSLLVCVNRSGLLHAFLDQSSRFCVNLLKDDHAGLSDIFSGKIPSHERFLHGAWDEDADGTPFLIDAQASIFCDKHQVVHYGSHSIFIGAVRSIKMSEDIRPLLYSNGAYSRCVPLAADLRPVPPPV